LAKAVSEFRRCLSPDQDAQLASTASNTPRAEDVLQLTDEIFEKNSDRKSRVFASRVQGLLSSVQQYCTIVDTCTGPNQTAALVWGCVKLFILVNCLYLSPNIADNKSLANIEFRRILREAVKADCSAQHLLPSVVRIRETFRRLVEASTCAFRLLRHYRGILF
jgi:hypothetical protein